MVMPAEAEFENMLFKELDIDNKDLNMNPLYKLIKKKGALIDEGNWPEIQHILKH